ncbi:MAG: type II toxin-antitoxin system HicB family antitoxin [Saprospiraceae bacterium]|nr:type II toxin-antitoxin system HicB family antitoxin [Saprospiraceae bacterium]
MTDILQYKDFIGSIHFSTPDEVFYGKLEGVSDLVTFEGSNVKELKKSFKEAVEDYIELCLSLKKSPYKSFKGTFNVRIKPELHSKAFAKAILAGMTLNQFVEDAIEKQL